MDIISRDKLNKVLKYIIHSFIIYLSIRFFLPDKTFTDIMKVIVICQISFIILDMYVPTISKISKTNKKINN
jgi:hypothetical protein